MAYLTFQDPLTALPNRSLLKDRLQQAILTTKCEQKPVALLVLELDGFRAVHDTRGSDGGDRVLRQVARRLRALLCDSNTLGRLGDDEFAILLPITGLEGALFAAHRILKSLEQPLLVDGRRIPMRVSIGIAGFPAHAVSGDELLSRAEVAMDWAKADGSGVAIYTPTQDSVSTHGLALTRALCRALVAQRFVLEYQPIVQLRTGAILGVEALIRWDHPEHGRVLPKDVIQGAECSGLIPPMTECVIGRALADWSVAARPRPAFIAVTLSLRSMHDESLPERLRRVLATRGVSPSSLVLEIPEPYIMSDQERAIRCFHELHAIGIRLLVDDFGTGYSSLSYLRRLPVDQLKIDPLLVIGLAVGDDDTFVRSIIDVAHDLGLGVTAEGVDTGDVLDRLRTLGCDAAQGRFIGGPASASGMAASMGRQEMLESVSDVGSPPDAPAAEMKSDARHSRIRPSAVNRS